ncbi:MAG: DUF2975 domain-containing protein [Bacteroides sp.]|nr:DUF2975 domain-containing protein [Bacteroides sp.]
MNFAANMAGFMIGVEAGQSSLQDPEKLQYLQNLADVSLRPVSGHILIDSVYNEVTASFLPVMHSRMIVGLPAADASPSIWKAICTLFLFLAFIILVTACIVFFIRLIIAINKSDIFNWKNVSRLYKMGGCLIAIFALELTSVLLTSRQAAHLLSIPGYEINSMDSLSFTTLILGGCALLVGEIFAIGLRLKEEQELTI